ncbi:MAG: hypothetical protein ACREV7_05185 [Steroidobacteraceae bacterium]
MAELHAMMASDSPISAKAFRGELNCFFILGLPISNDWSAPHSEHRRRRHSAIDYETG